METHFNNILTEKILVNEINVKDFDINDLISSDNYNETKILKKLKSYNDETLQLLYKCTLQMAIIGYGRKNYGSIRVNDKVMTVVEIFDRLKIKYNENQNSLYNDDDLSARRLLRIFRYQIQNYIETHRRPSFLWFKYSDKSVKEYYKFCFPGGEHLVENIEQANFMMKTYGNVDNRLGTKFCDRLTRVFIAMGIYVPTI